MADHKIQSLSSSCCGPERFAFFIKTARFSSN